MREILFRAWDKKISDFIFFGLIDTSICSNYTLTEWINLPKNQYTGLKDKNGKMIFENDIVKYTKPQSFGGEVFMGAVFYDDCSASFYLKGNCDVFCFDYDVICEVIGNIYTTPELLNS